MDDLKIGMKVKKSSDERYIPISTLKIDILILTEGFFNQKRVNVCEQK